MSDLIERLEGGAWGSPDLALLKEAATAIRSLTEERDRLIGVIQEYSGTAHALERAETDNAALTARVEELEAALRDCVADLECEGYNTASVRRANAIIAVEQLSAETKK